MSSSAASQNDASLFSPEFQKKRYEAAMEYLKVAQPRFAGPDGQVHAGTVLAIVARLAGTSLFRSLHYQTELEPGVVALSQEVNEAWPQLLNLFAFYCQQNGFNVMAKPLTTMFPAKDKPRLDVGQVQADFQDQYNAVMKKHGLDHLNAARTGMVVCSVIFQYHAMVAKDIDPYVATGIVALGVQEGAKTAPPPLLA